MDTLKIRFSMEYDLLISGKDLHIALIEMIQEKEGRTRLSPFKPLIKKACDRIIELAKEGGACQMCIDTTIISDTNGMKPISVNMVWKALIAE